MLLTQLSVYRFDTVRKTEYSRDVLHDFYQNLVPEELRKSLGAFYTPDWLVEHSVAKLDYSNAKCLTARVLGPTCGTGSFLLETLEQKRCAALAAGWGAGRIVDMLTTTVWGFDLNPLAVQSSRVNFLIAISDLLQQCKGKDIEILVLLADAIYSPAPQPNGDQKTIRYSIGSEQINLQIVLPIDLAGDRVLLDQVFQLMGTSVENNDEYPIIARALIKSFILTEIQAGEWKITSKRHTTKYSLCIDRVGMASGLELFAIFLVGYGGSV